MIRVTLDPDPDHPNGTHPEFGDCDGGAGEILTTARTKFRGNAGRHRVENKRIQ